MGNWTKQKTVNAALNLFSQTTIDTGLSMSEQIDEASANSLLMSLVQHSAPKHDPKMFKSCRFHIEGGVVKLVAGDLEEAARLMNISATLSPEREAKFRKKGYFLIDELNIENLKTTLAARLLDRLTARVWFPNSQSDLHTIEANQWSVRNSHKIPTLLISKGIIKDRDALKIKHITDGHSDHPKSFHWHKAILNISDINLNALLIAAKQIGMGL